MKEVKFFSQLTAGDTVYIADVGQMTYKEKSVERVDMNKVYVDYQEIPRLKKTECELQEYQRYNNGKKILYFTKESDAIRYCKAQLMKVLFSKIDTVKRVIDGVKKFKEEHHELLNHEWTEKTIAEFEKQYNKL